MKHISCMTRMLHDVSLFCSVVTLLRFINLLLVCPLTSFCRPPKFHNYYACKNLSSSMKYHIKIQTKEVDHLFSLFVWSQVISCISERPNYATGKSDRKKAEKTDLKIFLYHVQFFNLLLNAKWKCFNLFDILDNVENWRVFSHGLIDINWGG